MNDSKAAGEAPEEPVSIGAEIIAALDRYRESIGPDQHYTSQQAAMQDAVAYATVFVVMPILKRH